MNENNPKLEGNPYQTPQTDDSKKQHDFDRFDRVLIVENSVMKVAGKGSIIFFLISFIFGFVVIKYPDSLIILNIGVSLFAISVACLLTYIIASIMQCGKSTGSS